MTDYYKIIISPETILKDLSKVQYSGQTVGVYSAMTQVVSGGVMGNSILTGLTIPILFRQTSTDIGYYSPFDGAILQMDVVTNFLFSSTTTSPYTYSIYNTSEEYQKFLELSQYKVDWGDGSSEESITVNSPNYISHIYPSENRKYKITLKQINPWGINLVEKTISTPFKNESIFNPKGRAFFSPNIGSWSGTSVSYDFIFSGDQYNQVSNQVSSAYVTVPYYVSGVTKSRLTELQLYGNPKYQVGVPVIKDGQIWGAVSDISQSFTAYTIQNINYYDYFDGTTIYFIQSSGFTEDNITSVPIVKDEFLLKITDQAQIQTDVYIERGKQSGFERVRRIGEIDNLGDMINYGYGFFNVVEKN
jgi:hypothetical protein